MKFPKRIKHRGRVLATIYGKSKSYPSYRVAWTAAGKRMMKAFPRYGEAKRHADGKVKELAKGSQAAALTAGQARDALVALERLEAFHQSTGRRVSLLSAVSEFVEGAAKLNGRSLGEAVAEFLQADAPRTRATDGQRAQLSAKYAYNREIQLRRFAATFPNTAVCDLSREHLDVFFGSQAEFSAKSRNHYRGAVRQFLQWAVRKDYLTATHRLVEADAMRPERGNTAEILFYSPKEFRALLEGADGSMRALLAIGGLAGLRTSELLRITWADVWRVPGHIEVTARNSKTRQRRLVEIGPALSAWLEPFRALTDGKLWGGHEISFQRCFGQLCEQVKVTRKANALRHSFCSYHFAAHANENLTAQQAGHAPSMVHTNYKGLATKAEAEKWFDVKPPTSAKNLIPMPTVSRKEAQ